MLRQDARGGLGVFVAQGRRRAGVEGAGCCKRSRLRLHTPAGLRLQQQLQQAAVVSSPSSGSQQRRSLLAKLLTGEAAYLHMPPPGQEVGRNDDALCPRRSAACHRLPNRGLSNLHVGGLHQAAPRQLPARMEWW